MLHPGNRFLVSLGVLSWLLCAGGVPSCPSEETPAVTSHFSADAVAVYQAASQVSAQSAADILFLENQESVSIDAEGKAVRTRYYVYKILTQKGATEWDTISAGWEPWREERPVLRARVITPDLVVHPLDPKTITEAPGRVIHDNIFSDSRVVRAPLPAVAPGSLVEEEQVSRQSTPFIGGSIVERFYFSASVAIQHTQLVLDAPAALPLRYDVGLLPNLKPQRTEADGRVHIVFESGPIEGVEDVDPGLPSDVPAYASITFATGASWQQLAAGYGSIVDNKLGASDLKSLGDKIVAGQQSREQKISAILQYLQREVRYTGVELSEATIVPRSPKETLTRKYGDCKDKAALLVALLRAADISAYVALLNAGSAEDVSADLPGLEMFDHAIVYVPGSPDVWIDPTDEYARLGELPNADQGRLALIARPESTALSVIPSASSADNRLAEKREIFLAENGPARVVETAEPHGSDESSYRRTYVDKENKNARDELINYMKSQYLADKLDRMERSEPRDLSRQFQLVLESDHARRGSTDLEGAAAAIRLEGLFSRLPELLREREEEDHEKNNSDKEGAHKPKRPRTADYELPQAFITEWRYTITPPAGFQPKPLPQNVEIAAGPARLTEEFSAEKDGVIHAVIRFDTVKRRLTAAEGHELRDKVAQIIDGQPILIYFEPIGQALLNQGKVREALKAYHDLIALYPKGAVHHLRLAKAFLAAGLGEAARAEAQTAVKLEPKSALAEKTLAEILEYDVVGRQFRPGSDYAGAEAAYRAAIALDPEDKTTIADLGKLLEYNHWGLRYGPGAPLKKALAEYRKLTKDEIAEFGMQTFIPYALFYDGQFAEARAAAEGLTNQPVELIIACEAAIDGSQAALEDARKRTESEVRFKQVAESAGDMLVKLRKYSVASDLEEAGAAGPNASETAAYAALYRKTVPHEQFAFADDPVGSALRVVVLMDDPDITIDQARSVTSRNGAKVLATKERIDATRNAARATISGKARKGEFSNVGLDLSLTRAQPKVQGNDATGYKVTLWPSSNYKSVRYIVKEDGHYRLLGSVRRDGSIGLEILDRIAANDLGGARILLDWFREDWHLEVGDDPLAVDAFPRMWTKGQEADAAHMKLAAAAALVFDKVTAAAGVSILEKGLKSTNSDTEKLNIETALAKGYRQLDDYAKALLICEDLVRQYPESDSLFYTREFNLLSLGRYDEADAVAQIRLKRNPGDMPAMRSLAFNAQARGDYTKENIAWQKLIADGQPEAVDLNNASWSALFTGKVQSADVENALKANELDKDSPGYLHTLGCVYAEIGKTKEAREVLIQSMDAYDLDEPNENFWYAFGRIAEQYGERDVAVAYYKRVSKPEEAYQLNTSAYRLAQIRLADLENQK